MKVVRRTTVLYGGRIDNAFDFRVLRYYLKQYFSGEIMGQRVKKDNDSTVLPLPMSLPRPSTDREDYIEFARSLAETDSPEQFGLPLNVERYVNVTEEREENAIYVISALMYPYIITF